jgi:hypothetical protein
MNDKGRRWLPPLPRVPVPKGQIIRLKLRGTMVWLTIPDHLSAGRLVKVPCSPRLGAQDAPHGLQSGPRKCSK